MRISWKRQLKHDTGDSKGNLRNSLKDGKRACVFHRRGNSSPLLQGDDKGKCA